MPSHLLQLFSLFLFLSGHAHCQTLWEVCAPSVAALVRKVHPAFRVEVPFDAVENGDWQRLKSFSAEDLKAPLSQRSGLTPLQLAIRHKRYDLVEKLLDIKGIANDGNSKQTALDVATASNAPLVLRQKLFFLGSRPKLTRAGAEPKPVSQFTQSEAKIAETRFAPHLAEAVELMKEQKWEQAYEKLTDRAILKGTGFELNQMVLDYSENDLDRIELLHYKKLKAPTTQLAFRCLAQSSEVEGLDYAIEKSLKNRQRVPSRNGPRQLGGDPLPDYPVHLVKLAVLEMDGKSIWDPALDSQRDIEKLRKSAVLLAFEEMSHVRQALNRQAGGTGYLSNLLSSPPNIRAFSKTIRDIIRRQSSLVMDRQDEDHVVQKEMKELDVYASMQDAIGIDNVPDWFETNYVSRQLAPPRQSARSKPPKEDGND